MVKRNSSILKSLLFRCLCCLFSLLILYEIGLSQWEDAVVQRLTEDFFPNALKGFLYIDSNDKLHLFYKQAKQTHRPFFGWWVLYITKEKGKSWSELDTIEQLEDKLLYYEPDSDIIHAAYIQVYLDTIRLYYTNSSLNWEPVMADSTGRGYRYLGIQLDSLGNVHLLWNYDYPIDTTGYRYYKVMYATNCSGGWVTQKVSPPLPLGYTESAPSYLSVERNGIAHIIFRHNYIYHYHNRSPGDSVWIVDTLSADKYGAPWNAKIPLVVDGDGGMHLLTGRFVSFVDSYYVYYSYRESMEQPWGEPELVGESGAGYEIFIDQQKDVRILWKKRDHRVILGTIFYATKKNGIWESTMILDNEPYWSEDCSFVIDSEGKGHLVFNGHFDSSCVHDSTSEIYYLGESISWVDTTSDKKGLKFELFQNYPNPFNSSTSIQYSVSSDQSQPIPTTLKIYNILGEEVRTLVDGKKKPKEYKVLWDGKDKKGKEVSSGVYFYKLSSGDFHQTKKLVLIK